MPLFARRPTLDEALEKVRAELRAGTLSPDVFEDLRRRDQPLVSGGLDPPGFQETLEAIPGAAALLEVGGRMAARNAAMASLAGEAETILQATRSAELQEVCARGLAGWPHRRDLTLPAQDVQVEAMVAPLSHARALLVLRDLSAERRADRVRRDFIANASHELRTPVTAVRAAAETLLEGGLALPAQARDFVQHDCPPRRPPLPAHRGPARLSRLETGAWKLQPGPVRLAEVADSVIDLFRDRARGKRIALAADVPERLRANADRQALEQILSNLVDNAVKYTSDGGRVTVLGDGLGPTVIDLGRGHRPRRSPAAPCPHLRALLPGRCRPLARAGRYRAGAGHRQAPGPGHGRRGRRGKLAERLALLGEAAVRLNRCHTPVTRAVYMAACSKS